ncbi:hypothetical protein GBAR_LOCUS24716, partial [Geodia barretti]
RERARGGSNTGARNATARSFAGRLCFAHQYTQAPTVHSGHQRIVMAEATLTPDDASDVVDELVEANTKSFPLGLFLLPTAKVEAIHAQFKNPQDRLTHIIIEFLKQAEPRPTWRAIVNALRSPSVALTALARKLEAAHFPDSTSTCYVAPETTDTESAADTTAVDNVKLNPSPQLSAVPAPDHYNVATAAPPAKKHKKAPALAAPKKALQTRFHQRLDYIKVAST